MKAKVSILILTHNAPNYVVRTIESLSVTPRESGHPDYEVIVLDNASNRETRELLNCLKQRGLIQKLILSDENTLFARGNNLAAGHCAPDSTHLLLLNSDVTIRDKDWLLRLLELKERGTFAVASFGFKPHPPRADGYCFLIDRPLFERYRLNEAYPWWWSITLLQAELLRDGHQILAIRHHDRLLVHHGGKSGSVPANTPGMKLTNSEVSAWFQGAQVTTMHRADSMCRMLNNQMKRFKQWWISGPRNGNNIMPPRNTWGLKRLIPSGQWRRACMKKQEVK